MLFDDFCFCVINRFVFVLVDKKFSCFCVLWSLCCYIVVLCGYKCFSLCGFDACKICACGAIDCELLCGGCICSV